MTDATTYAEAVRSAYSRAPADALPAALQLAVAHGPFDAGSIRSVHRGRLGPALCQVGPEAIDADRVQVELGQGPSLDALSRRTVLFSRDLRVEPRWPAWSPAAVHSGAVAVTAVRLETAKSIGVLTLYARNPIAPDAENAVQMSAVGAHLSVLLDLLRANDNLQRAVAARTIVGQAQGILMDRHGLSAADAFATLRRASQAQNVKLAVLARALVDTGRLPGAVIERSEEPPPRISG